MEKVLSSVSPRVSLSSLISRPSLTCYRAYSSIIGATTNWDGTIYGSILEEYETTVFMLNIGQALLILMLGVANLIFTPLSDSESRRDGENSVITANTRSHGKKVCIPPELAHHRCFTNPPGLGSKCCSCNSWPHAVGHRGRSL